MTIKKADYHGKIINHNQYCGIETYIADNGAAKGARVAWVNTGSPLRFKVAIDRGLDIVDAFFGEYSLAWLSHMGVSGARPDIGEQSQWLQNFSGGLLTTCGLSNVGGATEGQGLHGRYSNIAAELESVCQPQLTDARPKMTITGTMRETAIFGSNLELKRTITAFAGEARILIEDKVVNAGNQEAPLMLLYHCNFGWQLVDAGSRLFYKGEAVARDSDGDRAVFNSEQDYKQCRAPMTEHCGSGEACGFIEAQSDDDGFCRAGIYNPQLEIAAVLKFEKSQLPCLTNWQHWGYGEYVTGLEPGTNYPIGQTEAKKQGKLIMLKPQETRDFRLEISVVSGKNGITTPEFAGGGSHQSR